MRNYWTQSEWKEIEKVWSEVGNVTLAKVEHDYWLYKRECGRWLTVRKVVTKKEFYETKRRCIEFFHEHYGSRPKGDWNSDRREYFYDTRCSEYDILDGDYRGWEIVSAEDSEKVFDLNELIRKYKNE